MSLRFDGLTLCERVIEDSQSGSLTLVNCLDEVTAWSLPSTYPGFGFAARFSCESTSVQECETVEFRFVRRGEQGQEDVVVRTDAQVHPSTSTVRVFFNFAVLRLFREEVVWFRVDWRRAGQRWRRGHEVPLRVSLLPQEARAQMRAELDQLDRALEQAGQT